MNERIDDSSPATCSVTEEELKQALTSMASRFEEELYALKQDELEQHWHFAFDVSRSIAGNLYDFHEKLKLYGHFCRRWEEHHNGHCCVVERVRDTYLMPKIRAFAERISPNIPLHLKGKEGE